MTSIITGKAFKHRSITAMSAVFGALMAMTTMPAMAADPGLTNTSIKIGMMGPLTGTSSLLGYPIINGALAVYKEINEKGGIHGRQIEFLVEDSGCAPDKAVAAAKKLIHRSEVFLLHAENCSGAALAIKDDAIENKVPFVVMAAAAPALVNPVNKYVFTVAQDGVKQAETLLAYVLSMPEPRRVAVVHHPDEWGNERADPVVKGLKAQGINPVAVETMDRNMADATAQIQKLQRAQANVVALLMYPGEVAIFLRDAMRYGYAPASFGTGGSMDLHDLATRAGSYDAINRYNVVAYLKGPVESEVMKPAVQLFNKHFPNAKPLAITFIGMGGAYVVAEALQRAGRDLTREKFLAAMESIREYDNGVNSCLFTYTPTNHTGCTIGTMWTTVEKQIVILGPTWKPEHVKP